MLDSVGQDVAEYHLDVLLIRFLCNGNVTSYCGKLQPAFVVFIQMIFYV
jgi:hypothetical protein